MPESKHTPAPWSTVTYASADYVPFHEGQIKAVMADTDIAYLANANLAYEEINANATLIAAAPDLLEACRLLYELVAKSNEQDLADNIQLKSAGEFLADVEAAMETATTKARAAIAKATVTK